MSFVIRRAAAGDAAAFAAIGAATFALACPPSTPQVDLDAHIAAELSAARFAEQIGDPLKGLFAAQAGATIAGYLLLSRGTAPAEVAAQHPLKLQQLYVLPAFHGGGVAAALMARACSEAAALDCDALWLGVSEHNQRGIAFYRKHGFAVVGEEHFAVGQDIHRDHVMARRLVA